MATPSSIFAWKIPWTEVPGGLQSMGPQSDMTKCTHTFLTGGMTLGKLFNFSCGAAELFDVL